MNKGSPKSGPQTVSVPTKIEALGAAPTLRVPRSPRIRASGQGGLRGPTLLEDFRPRERTTRFDHEDIPEQVMHARGLAAHGYFQVYDRRQAAPKRRRRSARARRPRSA